MFWVCLVGGPYCGLRTGDIGTALFGNVWVNDGRVPPLQPLNQNSVNKYVALAEQQLAVRSPLPLLPCMQQLVMHPSFVLRP